MNEVEINNEQFEEIFFNFSNPQIESNKTSQIEEEKTQKNPWTTACKRKYENPLIEIHYVGHLLYKWQCKSW